MTLEDLNAQLKQKRLESYARAVVVTAIWIALPDARFTLLPLSVAVIYLLTVIVIYVDSGTFRARLNLRPA